MSHTSENHRDEQPQGDAKQQLGGGNEPSDNLEQEIRNILSMLEEDESKMKQRALSAMQEIAAAEMREEVDEFGMAVTQCLGDRANVVGEFVSEINAALGRIAESEKKLDAIKATIEAAGNVLD